MITRIGLIFIVVLSCFAQDDETTNYKTGIDVYFSGSRGTNWAEEYLYYDKLIDDHKTVYIREDTEITMVHNTNNSKFVNGATTYVGINGLDGTPDSGDEGTIRFKIDRDLQWLYNWAWYQPMNPQYTGAFTFASLTYGVGTNVVGTTGPVPEVLITDRTNYYHRGILDSFGDEWHTMQVADDDGYQRTNIPTFSVEWLAGDGKVINFVVNPKTPCLTLRTNSETAQFYTTPAKVYFIPKIHPQTSYVTDGVNVHLKDLYGSNVVYRLNGGAWTTNSDPVLSTSDWSDWTNTLEYHSSNTNYIKTRVFVKNPAYPSAGESHGYLAWGTAYQYGVVTNRIRNVPYGASYTNWTTKETYALRNWHDTNSMTGRRMIAKGISIDAFLGKMLGWGEKPSGKTKTYLQYTKGKLLQCMTFIDSVGFEMNHSGVPIPSKELNYRGYYDVDRVFDAVFAYDILIADCKASQISGGVTPIEDLRIRDMLASFMHDCMLCAGGYRDIHFDGHNPGMWVTARNIGAFCTAIAMPNYSTTYYGTSGYGNSANNGIHDIYPNSTNSWSQIFVYTNATVTAYPNLEYVLDVDAAMITEDGMFIDKVDYYDDPLMGHCFYIYVNQSITHIGRRYPYLEASFTNAVNGVIVGMKETETWGAKYFQSLMVLNPYFTGVANIGIPKARAIEADDPDYSTTSEDLARSLIFGVSYYDDAWPYGRQRRAVVKIRNNQ